MMAIRELEEEEEVGRKADHARKEGIYLFEYYYAVLMAITSSGVSVADRRSRECCFSNEINRLGPFLTIIGMWHGNLFLFWGYGN